MAQQQLGEPLPSPHQITAEVRTPDQLTKPAASRQPATAPMLSPPARDHTRVPEPGWEPASPASRPERANDALANYAPRCVKCGLPHGNGQADEPGRGGRHHVAPEAIRNRRRSSLASGPLTSLAIPARASLTPSMSPSSRPSTVGSR